MKHIILSLFTLNSSLLTLHADVPVQWTVDMSRAQPATFEEYQGETLDFKAALMLDGKPFEAPLNYSFYWQTNGMGRYYWEAPCTPSTSPTNVLFATWSPTNDVGAKVYNCFIGKPGTIYHAAFQLRLRPSPGATPNELPLPQKVIDFANVTVLNPPWSGGGGGGVDTNAVREIVQPMIAASTNNLRRVNDLGLHNYETNGVGSAWTLLSDDGSKTNRVTGVFDNHVWYFYVGQSYVAGGQRIDYNGREWRIGFVGEEYIGSLGIAFREYEIIDTDRLATTNGVNDAIAANERKGYSDQVVRGKREQDGTWDIKVNRADLAEELNGGLEWDYIYGTPTTLSGYGITDAAPISMISATDPTFSNEVATVARTVSPPPSPYLRLYDEVRQCWWIGRMVNGVINWEVE